MFGLALYGKNYSSVWFDRESLEFDKIYNALLYTEDSLELTVYYSLLSNHFNDTLIM